MKICKTSVAALVLLLVSSTSWAQLPDILRSENNAIELKSVVPGDYLRVRLPDGYEFSALTTSLEHGYVLTFEKQSLSDTLDAVNISVVESSLINLTNYLRMVTAFEYTVELSPAQIHGHTVFRYLTGVGKSEEEQTYSYLFGFGNNVIHFDGKSMERIEEVTGEFLANYKNWDEGESL